MDSIFPPSGEQDKSRPLQIKSDQERDYLWFSLEFCALVLNRRPIHTEALELAANHFTALGYFADGLRLDERLAALRPDDPGVLYNLSCSLALTGRRDEAFRQLALAVENGYRDHGHMATDMDLASLRGDERFMALVARAAKASGSPEMYHSQSES